MFINDDQNLEGDLGVVYATITAVIWGDWGRGKNNDNPIKIQTTFFLNKT